MMARPMTATTRTPPRVADSEKFSYVPAADA
jgi:hypothetical protein